MLEVIVRTSHLDLMGHVNNAKYVEFLEWGRCDELTKRGINLIEMIQRGLGFAVVNLDINFRREAFFDEHLLVETVFKEFLNDKIVVLDQRILRKESREVVCDARVTFLTFDMKAHRSIPVPEELRRLISSPAPDENDG